MKLDSRNTLNQREKIEEKTQSQITIMIVIIKFLKQRDRESFD